MTGPCITATMDELRVAWRRTKFDHAQHRFVDHPHLVAWIDLDADAWLEGIMHELASGYSPRPAVPCWVPKPGSLLRPGTILDVRDEVVFAFLVGRMLRAMHAKMRDTQGNPDVAYQLAKTAWNPAWIQTSFVIWAQWRKRSLSMLSDRRPLLLSTDITGFYDNIDIQKLSSDLRELVGRTPELLLLMECLRAWSYPRDRGVPQGYSASHLLAKLYLHSVDTALRNAGFVHLRWVDDFRFFLESKRSGELAIAELTKLLHNRGLSIQSAKTRIKSRSDAQAEIEGVAPTIASIRATLQEELKELAGLPEEYLPVWEVDRILQSGDNPPPEVLERAFQEYFLFASGDGFDKTLFHYLLTRLGKVRSTVAVDYCIDCLRARPEETKDVFRYLAAVGVTDTQLSAITTFMGSSEALHDHQLYHFVRWAFWNDLGNQDVLRLSRAWSFDLNRAPWLRSYSVAYLGRYGESSDLEALEASVSRAATALERADIVAGLRRMETARRNSLYGRLASVDELVERAVTLAKTGLEGAPNGHSQLTGYGTGYEEKPQESS